MEQELRDEFTIPDDWSIIRGKSLEKERINQSTETTEFVAVSPEGENKRTFIHTLFCNHKGSKSSWRETT